MAFRTVLIEKAVNIRLDLNNIVVNYENEKFWLNIDEISVLIIDDPRCNISLITLAYLCEKGCTVLFCDHSHMPVGTLQTLSMHSRMSKKTKNQISWDKKTKDYLWTEIVKGKIDNQINTLNLLNKNKINILTNLKEKIEIGDPTNREGTSSRVYFKELFGENFKRFNEDIVNYCLNYIYQIIRSKISQEIVAYGYSPSLGIHHKSELNSFNLADDLIEPFRGICDYFIYNILQESNEDYLTSEIKYKIVNILNEVVIFNNHKYKIHSVIQFYIQNVFSFLETGDSSYIKFPEL